MAIEFGVITGFVGKIFEPLLNFVDDMTLSKEEKAQFKNQLQTLQFDITKKALDLEARHIEAAADVIKTEAKGESWMQRNWRPMLMLTIVSIIGNNYILLPYAGVLGLPIQPLTLPSELYALMTVGVGGYIGSRGFEKVAKTKAMKTLLENEKAGN